MNSLTGIDPNVFGPYGQQHLQNAGGTLLGGKGVLDAADTHEQYRQVLRPLTPDEKQNAQSKQQKPWIPRLIG
jgi:hypothetical protein